MTATVTADGIAGLLPSLASVPSMSAVDTADMATAVRGLATEFAYDGTDDVESAIGLRRQLHALASVIAQQRGLPPDVLVDIDTATRLVERAAVGAIVRAQQAGQLDVDDDVATTLLGKRGPEMYRLHGLTDWSAFAVALDQCRAAGVVTLSALQQRIDGEPPAAVPATQTDEPAPIALSTEEMTVAVRGMITNVACSAEFARGLTERDVSTLSPAVAADLAKTLWDQMVITTRAYAVLQRRGQQRR